MNIPVSKQTLGLKLAGVSKQARLRNDAVSVYTLVLADQARYVCERMVLMEKERGHYERLQALKSSRIAMIC